MRILITGSDGQLGHELRRVLHGHDLIALTWPKFDLLTPACESAVRAVRPDVVIHAAAYTDVDGAEREPDQAMAVNALGTEHMARAAAAVDARLILLSTDYVFDGSKRTPYVETDKANPVNAYGRSKLEAERRAMATCPNILVVRTAWLYGHHGKNFPKTIMRLTTEQSELRVVGDQRGCPTHAGDLADAIARIVDLDLRGVVHATGAGDCTWHEFAQAIVRLLGKTNPVRSITTAEAGRPAPRPAYSVLANHRLAEQGITLPHWVEAIRRFVEEEKAVRSSTFEVRCASNLEHG